MRTWDCGLLTVFLFKERLALGPALLSEAGLLSLLREMQIMKL